MELQLQDYKVTIKDQMAWGDVATLNSEGMATIVMTTDRKDLNKMAGGKASLQVSGQTIMANKMLAAKILITKILNKDNNAVPFSDDWMYNLPVADGKMLDDTLTDIVQKAMEVEKK